MNIGKHTILSLSLSIIIIAAITTKDIERLHIKTPFCFRSNNPYISNRTLNPFNKKLLEENTELRKLLHLKPRLHPNIIIGSILSSHPNNWNESILLDLGSSDNIPPLSLVFKEEGIIGQITSVQKTTSLATLLNDPNTLIPSITSKTHIKGIVSGDHNNIIFSPLKNYPTPMVGENIVSFIPSNSTLPQLPIGTISSLQHRHNTIICHITPTTKINPNDAFVMIFPTPTP